MMFDGIDLLAVLAAAVASFAAGAVWYGLLGKVWMRAARLDKAAIRPRPLLFIGSFVCQLVMALIFAGIIYHAGPMTVANGVLSAVLVWTGFLATTLIVNHRFQGASWGLTLIDGGHWLAVLIVQGVVLGLMG